MSRNTCCSTRLECSRTTTLRTFTAQAYAALWEAKTKRDVKRAPGIPGCCILESGCPHQHPATTSPIAAPAQACAGLEQRSTIRFRQAVQGGQRQGSASTSLAWAKLSRANFHLGPTYRNTPHPADGLVHRHLTKLSRAKFFLECFQALLQQDTVERALVRVAVCNGWHIDKKLVRQKIR
jgi:hypothetical protein